MTTEKFWALVFAAQAALPTSTPRSAASFADRAVVEFSKRQRGNEFVFPVEREEGED